MRLSSQDGQRAPKMLLSFKKDTLKGYRPPKLSPIEKVGQFARLPTALADIQIIEMSSIKEYAIHMRKHNSSIIVASYNFSVRGSHRLTVTPPSHTVWASREYQSLTDPASTQTAN